MSDKWEQLEQAKLGINDEISAQLIDMDAGTGEFSRSELSRLVGLTRSLEILEERDTEGEPMSLDYYRATMMERAGDLYANMNHSRWMSEQFGYYVAANRLAEVIYLVEDGEL